MRKLIFAALALGLIATCATEAQARPFRFYGGGYTPYAYNYGNYVTPYGGYQSFYNYSTPYNYSSYYYTSPTYSYSYSRPLYTGPFHSINVSPYGAYYGPGYTNSYYYGW
jgi:hypothetical protein